MRFIEYFHKHETKFWLITIILSSLSFALNLLALAKGKGWL